MNGYTRFLIRISHSYPNYNSNLTLQNLSNKEIGNRPCALNAYYNCHCPHLLDSSLSVRKVKRKRNDRLMTLLGLNQMESLPLAKRIIAKVGRRGRTQTAVTGAAMVRPRRRGLGRRAGKRKSFQTMMTRPRTVKGVVAQVTTSRSPRKRNQPPRNERGNWMSQLPPAGTFTLLFKSAIT